MPTYEYACKTCDQHVEVVQSFTDEPLTTCEACGGALRRVIHAAGIMFKGSGFYSTDRRSARAQSGSHGKEGEKSSSSAESESSKDAPKTDASKNGSGDKSSDKAPASSGKTTNKKAAEKSA